MSEGVMGAYEMGTHQEVDGCRADQIREEGQGSKS